MRTTRWPAYLLGGGAALLAGAFLLSGYQPPPLSTAPTRAVQQSGAAGAKTIQGAGPMPAWLAMADPMIIEDYAWAAEHHKELQYIPCYCGCGGIGHASNSACYFERDKNGTILAYDNHSSG